MKNNDFIFKIENLYYIEKNIHKAEINNYFLFVLIYSVILTFDNKNNFFKLIILINEYLFIHYIYMYLVM